MASPPPDRTCASCGKVFAKPVYLRRHQGRKTVCAPIVETKNLPPAVLNDPDLEAKKCRFCGRAFSSRQIMQRHMRNRCKIIPNERNGIKGMEQLYEHTIKTQMTEIADIRTQNVELKAQLGQMRTYVERLAASQNIDLPPLGTNSETVESKSITAAPSAKAALIQDRGGNIAIHGDHCQVNNITIKVFGRESQDHITVAQIKEVLDRSLRAPGIPTAIKDAILQVAMLVYSDASHPENITAYLPNKKTDDVLVHGENGWEVRPARLVLRPMAETTIDALFDKQPHENAERYSPLMQELRSNEQKYSEGTELRPLLVRNKDLLTRNNKDGGGEQP